MDVNEWERHPSFGLVSISRVQSTGRSLFESPFRHQHFITLSISRARRQRTDLHDTHIMADQEIVEISMSEVQFAAMMTTMNMGQGVPCTISHLDMDTVEEPPHDKTKETFEKEGAEHFTDLVKMAEELEELTNRKVSDLKAPERERMKFLAIKLQQGLTCNREFFQQQFQRTMDKVVGVAKAEIQAHIQSVVSRMGLESMKDQFKLEMK
jgi:hypothetical protein